MSCGLPERWNASLARSSQRSAAAGSSGASSIASGPWMRPRRAQSPRSVAMCSASSATDRQSASRPGVPVRPHAEERRVEGIGEGSRVIRLPGDDDRLLGQRGCVSAATHEGHLDGSRQGAGDEADRALAADADSGCGPGPHAIHRLQHPVEPFRSHRSRSPVANRRDADLEAGHGLGLAGPVERSAEVVDLGIEPLQPRGHLGSRRARSRRRARAAGRRRGAGRGARPSHRWRRADRPRTGGSSRASGSGWCSCGRRRRASDRRGDPGRRAWRARRRRRGRAPPGIVGGRRPPRHRASSPRRRPTAGAAAGGPRRRAGPSSSR